MSLLTNLVAYYKFESGYLTTSSVANYTLTNNGTVTANAGGKFGYCADYGSANTTKYFNIANNLGIDGGAITISTWLKLNTEIGSGAYSFALQGSVTSQVNYIMGYQYNAGARRMFVNRQKQNITNNESFGSVTLGTSSWHHCVLRYDGTNLSGWLDGVKVCADLATSGNGASAATSNVSFGFDNQYTGAYASMLQDSTGIWSRALSDAEIIQLSTGGKDYPFNTNFRDDFNDGTIDSAVWTTVGSVVETGGKAVLTGAGGSCQLTYKDAFSSGITFRAMTNCPRTVQSGHLIGFYFLDGPATTDRYIAFHNAWNLNANIWMYFKGDNGTLVNTDTGIAAGATQREFKIEWLQTGYAKFYIDGTLIYTSTTPLTDVPGFNGTLRFGNVYDSGMTMNVDWAEVSVMGNPPPFRMLRGATVGNASNF